MQIVNTDVERYIAALHSRLDEPALLGMEKAAAERDFPIVGRSEGATLELLARSIGARRVFELGSGFGYSAYWFARAVGPQGEVHCTDRDAANERAALDSLGRAGLADRIRFHVGDALETLVGLDRVFDVVFCDVDKTGYPAAWRAARERVRVGGLYIADNALWSGAVAAPDGTPETDAILEHNRLVAEDPGFHSVILPTRDGVMVALRLR